MMRQIKRVETIRDYINKILENQEIDCDEAWWDAPEAEAELEKLAGAEKNHFTSSEKMKIEGNEKLLFIAFRELSDSFCQDVQKEAASLVKDSKARALQLIFFVKDMRSRIRLEQTFDQSQRNRFLSVVRRAAGNNKLALRFTYVLDQNYESQPVKLKNLNRHEIMQVPPISGKVNLEKREDQEDQENDKAALYAMVFTTDLFQLVELYNLIGDRLFKNNVRFGISEFLGVDYSIRRTLEEEPEYFWFKNNGITLLVKSPDFRPYAAESLFLGNIGPEKEPEFSVINGAQTISTAAQYFFELESKAGMEEALKKAKSAQVLIRIIHVPKASTKEQQAVLTQKAKEISVALNRQKPIKMEDIAFTVPFSEKLADYLTREYKAGRAEFQLVRRGEGSETGQWMDLVQFSRARLACAGEPGEARSQGAKAFLAVRQKEGEPAFGNTTIFADGWLEAEGDEETKLFKRFYGAVWFAHRIAGEYEACRRSVVSDDADVLAVLGNGKWYFTAAVTQIVNQFAVFCEPGGREQPDFTEFHVSFESVRECIPQAMLLFAEAVAFYVRAAGKYERIDSNLFKNSALYRELTEGMKSGSFPASEGSGTTERFGSFVKLFSPDMAERLMTSAAAAATVMEPAAEYAGCIFLKGRRFFVKSVADAMEETIRYILENYSVDENEVLAACRGWLTKEKDEAEKRTGYFRSSVREIEVNGRTYWLGTSSNTRVKSNQIKNLCRLAGVGGTEIFWYVNSPDTPEFAW